MRTLFLSTKPILYRKSSTDDFKRVLDSNGLLHSGRGDRIIYNFNYNLFILNGEPELIAKIIEVEFRSLPIFPLSTVT